MAARDINTHLSACPEPDNEEDVRELLARIFAAAGTCFAAEKLEDTLYEHDLCRVVLLEQLTVQDVQGYLQMTIGEAMGVDNCLFPKNQHPAPVIIEANPVPSPIHAPVLTSRHAAEFPKLGADGAPSARNLRARPSGFQARLAGRVTQVTFTEPAALAGDA